MAKRILIAASILVASIMALTSCTPSTTSTTTTATTYTYTTTISSNSVGDFLTDAKNVYFNNISSNSTFPPTLKGISESDFLSLAVQSNSVIKMGGLSYQYVAISPFASNDWALPAEARLGEYTIKFFVPDIQTFGGTAIIVQADSSQTSGNFTYYYIPFQIQQASVYVETHSIGNLLFLFVYYYPSSLDVPEDNLWLVLLPTG